MANRKKHPHLGLKLYEVGYHEPYEGNWGTHTGARPFSCLAHVSGVARHASGSDAYLTEYEFDGTEFVFKRNIEVRGS